MVPPNGGAPTWLTTLIGVAFLGGLVVFALLRYQRTASGLEALAEELGLTHYEHGIRKVFNQAVRAFLERHRGRVVQGCGQELIYYRPTRMLRPVPFRPKDLKALLAEGKELIELLRA